ncbi:MAG: DUF2157 domain-containing protein [Elusimicrobiota bacterium]|jgi:uncharacterized membrane protein|nr:DUF2157 domain-containing protein [Elusimicrobiota bacterium]
MSLKTKLDDWLKNNLITETQKTAILDYEKSKAAKSNWMFYWLIMLACLAIGIGVISLIAYNWWGIPAWVKLVCGALILIALAAGYALFSQREKTAPAEICLSLLCIFILGYIGLVAQIFNLHSAPHRGVLFWVILTAPLAFTARKAIVPFVWSAAFLCIIPFELAQYKFMETLLKTIFTDHPSFAGVAIWWFAFFVFLWRAVPKIFYGFDNIRRSFGFLLGLNACFAALFMGMVPFLGSSYSPDFMWLFIFTGLLWPAAALAFVKKGTRRIWFCGCSLIWAGIILYSSTNTLGVFADMLYFVLFYLYAALYFDLEGRKKLCNFFLIASGVRLIVAYAQLSSGLLGFGVSMITSGVAAIALIFAWFRYKSTALAFAAKLFGEAAK